MSRIDHNANVACQLTDLLERQARMVWPSERPTVEPEIFAPALDLWENDEWVVVELELPGVARESIEAAIEGDMLVVSGIKGDQHACDPGAGKVSYQQLERKYGKFYREVRLPVPCNTRDIRARFANGVLLLEFKKIVDRRGERRIITID